MEVTDSGQKAFKQPFLVKKGRWRLRPPPQKKSFLFGCFWGFSSKEGCLLIAFRRSPRYFTSHSFIPTRELASACKFGTAVNIIQGLALGEGKWRVHWVIGGILDTLNLSSSSSSSSGSGYGCGGGAGRLNPLRLPGSEVFMLDLFETDYGHVQPADMLPVLQDTRVALSQSSSCPLPSLCRSSFVTCFLETDCGWRL